MGSCTKGEFMPGHFPASRRSPDDPGFLANLPGIYNRVSRSGLLLFRHLLSYGGIL
jgi:hypothetical protein